LVKEYVDFMNKIFKRITESNKIILDLIGANIINIFAKIIFRNNKNSNYILVYAPFKGEPWILNKIINDIKSSSQNSHLYKIFNSLFSLSIFSFKYGGNILSMHQSQLRKLTLAGFQLNKISTLYTHSRINQKGLQNIKDIKKIFCQNNYEYSLLRSYGIKSYKLINFPVGLHKNFLIDNNNLKNIEMREIDILFCLRYSEDNDHYQIRKRYEFIINLSNRLCIQNLKVCILGNGWDKLKKLLKKEVILKDVNYEEYKNFYQNSKIYCNPSLVEGGPISLIEAYSSGCIIFTTPVGLSFNYCLNDKLSVLMPFNADIKAWGEIILEKYKIQIQQTEYKEILSKREKNLNESTFSELAKNLEKNIINSPFT